MANAMGIAHDAAINDLRYWEADRIVGLPPPMLAKPLASLDAIYEAAGCRGAWYRVPGGRKHIGDHRAEQAANEQRRQQNRERRERHEQKGKGKRRDAGKGQGKGRGNAPAFPTAIPAQTYSRAERRAEQMIYREGGSVETEAASSGYRRADASGSAYSGAREGDSRPQQHPASRAYQQRYQGQGYWQ